MGKAIPTVYENGVFRPLDPVELTEGERVMVEIPPKLTDVPAFGQWPEHYEDPVTDRRLDRLRAADLQDVIGRDPEAEDRRHHAETRRQDIGQVPYRHPIDRGR